MTKDAPHGQARFALAIPAIAALLVIALAVLLVLLARPDQAALVDRYEEAADRAIAIGDGPTARLCAQRLVQLDPAEPLNHERLSLANALGQ